MGFDLVIWWECEDEVLEESREALSSRWTGGYGERPGLVDIDEGDLEGGKEEKDCCRCKPAAGGAGEGEGAAGG